MTIMEDVESLRRALLEATLSHVSFDGWSWAALYAAGEDVGVDRPAVRNAFPDGPLEVLELFGTESDYAMLTALELRNLAAMSQQERVALAIRTRLEQKRAHKEAVRRCLSVLAMPQHAALAMRMLSRTSDAICAAAGTAESGFATYALRTAVGGIYSATLLYWLEDRSPDSAATFAFLDRQVASAFRAGRRLERSLERLTSGARTFGRLRPRRLPRELRPRT